MWALFEILRSGGGRVAVVARSEADADESATFRKLSEVGSFKAQFDGRSPLSEVLASALEKTSAAYIVTLSNPKIVIDVDNFSRIDKGLACLEEKNVRWSLISAAGLGEDRRVRNVLYSSRLPSLPIGGSFYPIVDAFPDVFVLCREAASASLELLDGRYPRFGFELLVILKGYLDGRVALFAPFLGMGVNGEYLARDATDVVALVNRSVGKLLHGEVVNTFVGSVTITGIDETEDRRMPGRLLENAVKNTIAAFCIPQPVSVVTRTRFTREHLLRRLLSSVSRARPESQNQEVVIVSDEPRELIQSEIKKLQADFPYLTLVGKHNSRTEHSRVGNLIEGVSAATSPYVILIDDDDYLDPLFFENIRTAFFLGRAPIVFGDTLLHNEKWVKDPSGRYVLERTTKGHMYHRDGWRELFGGVNHLPICSGILPKGLLLETLTTTPLRYDLSEDYALFLALLTNPTLPEICEVPQVFCHVSVRQNEDNTVTHDDRSAWTHDISGFLYDIVTSDSPGKWQMYSAVVGRHNPISDKAAASRIEELERQRADLVSVLGRMKREITRLSAKIERTHA